MDKHAQQLAALEDDFDVDEVRPSLIFLYCLETVKRFPFSSFFYRTLSCFLMCILLFRREGVVKAMRRRDLKTRSPGKVRSRRLTARETAR